MNTKFLFLMITVLVRPVFSAEVGVLKLSGTGCESGAAVATKLEGVSDRYAVPAHLVLDKPETSRLERKGCQFALPFKVQKNEKLEVSAPSQKVVLKTSATAILNFSLTVFAVTIRNTKPLKLESKAGNTVEEEITQDGVLFETACGQDTIIRGDVNAFAKNSGASSARTEDLFLTIKTVSCL